MHVLTTHETILRQKEMIANLQATKLDAYAGLMRALGGGVLDRQAEQQVALPLP